MKKFELVAILRDVLPDDALDIVNTLISNGFKKIEVSLSNEEIGYSTIEKIIQEFKGKIEIGVGTVTKIKEINDMLKLGVDFIITPAFDKELVQHCINNKIDVLPGVFTPSDVMGCLNLGIDTMKFFPANTLGFDFVKALKGPFPKAKFFAVGGVNVENLKDFIKNGFVGAALGSDLVKRGATKADLDNISNKAKQYMELIEC